MGTDQRDGPLLCDCCRPGRRQQVGVIRDGKLIVFNKHHGVKHMAVIPLDKPQRTGV